MDNSNLWSGIRAFYEPTIEIMAMWMWGLPLFAAVVAIIFILSERPNGPISFKMLLNAAFPRDLHSHASARVDRWNAIILFVIGFPLVGLFALNGLAIATNVANLLSAEFGATAPLLHAAWAIVAVQFLVFFLATDFMGYWVHYWCHTNPFLWTLHKPHHTAETLTPWTLYRQHPIEFFIVNAVPAVFGGLVTGVALYATGTALHPGTMACVGIMAYILFFVIDFLSHVHVPVSYGWLDRIVLAPVMHNLHHSIELHHRDKNNAVVLTLWDWMFGTLYLPKKGETWPWGVNEEEFGDQNPHKTLKGFYGEPFVVAGRQIRDLVRVGRRHEAEADPK